MSAEVLKRKLQYIKSELASEDAYTRDIVDKEIYWFCQMYDSDVEEIEGQLAELELLEKELECIKQIREDLKDLVSKSITISTRNASRLGIKAESKRTSTPSA